MTYLEKKKYSVARAFLMAIVVWGYAIFFAWAINEIVVNADQYPFQHRSIIGKY